MCVCMWTRLRFLPYANNNNNRNGFRNANEKKQNFKELRTASTRRYAKIQTETTQSSEEGICTICDWIYCLRTCKRQPHTCDTRAKAPDIRRIANRKLIIDTTTNGSTIASWEGLCDRITWIKTWIRLISIFATYRTTSDNWLIYSHT